MMDVLKEGSTPGSLGSVSPTRWAKTEILCQCMMDHFLKYFFSRKFGYEFAVVCYDGHKSHYSLGLIKWAKSE